MMKHRFFRAALAITLLVAAFASGMLFQHLRSGYHCETREEKAYPSRFGTVQWRYVTESVGASFLDPGTTIISLGPRILYKAQRHFQESVPYARDVETSDQVITWRDGEFRFRLQIEPETPARPAQP